MKKKVCIIGVNYSYHVLLKSLQHLNKFKVVGIAGRKKREKFNTKGFIYYTSWKKMINDLKPNLVIVGVPPLEQEKILEFLLKNKIDFLCEKPITNKLEKIKLFRNLIKKNSNKKIVDLNFLTIPAIKKFKEIIKKIKINKKDLIKIDWFLNPKSKSNKSSWKNKRQKVGGELNNFFFHLVSVILYLFGDCKISILKQKNNFYIFIIQSKKINFRVNFFSKSNFNKFMIEVNRSGKKYTLINRSKDYHNNFKKKKNGNVIFNKNFARNKSRIFASKQILKLFLKKNDNLLKQTNLERGLQIQEKIINLNDK